jgi:hypothetical protein
MIIITMILLSDKCKCCQTWIHSTELIIWKEREVEGRERKRQVRSKLGTARGNFLSGKREREVRLC